jgi:hypothetical protein
VLKLFRGIGIPNGYQFSIVNIHWSIQDKPIVPGSALPILRACQLLSVACCESDFPYSKNPKSRFCHPSSAVRYLVLPTSDFRPLSVADLRSPASLFPPCTFPGTPCPMLPYLTRMLSIILPTPYSLLLSAPCASLPSLRASRRPRFFHSIIPANHHHRMFRRNN